MDSSDDEDDIFGFIRGVTAIGEDEVIEEPEIDLNITLSSDSRVLAYLDECFLLRAIGQLETLLSTGEYENMTLLPEEKQLVELCVLLLSGKHLEMIGLLVADESIPSTLSLSHMIHNVLLFEGDSVSLLRNIVINYLTTAATALQRDVRARIILYLGVCYYELYLRENYCGPELEPAEIELIYDKNSDNNGHNSIDIDEVRHRLDDCSAVQLECDGEYSYRTAAIMHTLLISRILLMLIADISSNNWQKGLLLQEDGRVQKSAYSKNNNATSHETNDEKTASSSSSSSSSTGIAAEIVRCLSTCSTRFWLSARACVVHYRLLQCNHYSGVPTLFKESQDGFRRAARELQLSGVIQSEVLDKLLKAPSSTLSAEDGEYEVEGAMRLGLADGSGENYNTGVRVHREAGKLTVSYFPTAQSASQVSDDTQTPSQGSQGVTVKDKPEKGRTFADEMRTDYAPFSTPHEASQSALQCQLLLEYGLSYHYFLYLDRGKRFFRLAKTRLRLYASLSGSMGKRTKYQQQDYAQLYCIARSSLVRVEGWVGLGEYGNNESKKNEQQGNELDRENVSADTGDDDRTKEQCNSWQHTEWETGRSLIREVGTENGEQGVAAVRQVLLDHCDGGAAENILLEGGPAYTDDNHNDGGALTPLDQAVLLALCIDVNNSNPIDGLTREEMEPYLRRVLQVSENWMIHSTGLLERSWLEFEKRRTADRAMLQIQALLDQHTTKLTIMQSTYKSIYEESAPVQTRLAYLNSIVYPSQYELKRDLAQRYLSCNVVVSALGYFRELEMWDDVVTCYQLMQKPQRAELVVKEQIASKGKTPYMLTALADLTGNIELYEEAWTLSEGRYARAKRTLAKIAFDKGAFSECAEHATLALKVQPLVATCWYLKGVACMRMQILPTSPFPQDSRENPLLNRPEYSHFATALSCFARCIQLDEEIGEAWANSGSIYMQTAEYNKALHAMEQAYRHKRQSWRLLENLVIASLACAKFNETLMYMRYLLNLGKTKVERRIMKEEMRKLSFFVTTLNRYHFRRSQQALHEGKENEKKVDDGNLASAVRSSYNMDELRDIVEADTKEVLYIPPSKMDKLTTKVEEFYALCVASDSEIASDPQVWDIISDFHLSLGQLNKVHESRLRQCRSLMMNTVTSTSGGADIDDKQAIRSNEATKNQLGAVEWFKTIEGVSQVSKAVLVITEICKSRMISPSECWSTVHLVKTALSQASTVYEEEEVIGGLKECYNTLVELHSRKKQMDKQDDKE